MRWPNWSTPTPVDCDTLNSMSIVDAWSSTATPQSPNTRVTALMLADRSVPVMRDRSRNCLASRSSGSPVCPVNVLRSAIALPVSAKPSGTALPTRLADSSSWRSASPVAPVPTRMVLVISRNSGPILVSAWVNPPMTAAGAAIANALFIPAAIWPPILPPSLPTREVPLVTPPAKWAPACSPALPAPLVSNCGVTFAPVVARCTLSRMPDSSFDVSGRMVSQYVPAISRHLLCVVVCRATAAQVRRGGLDSLRRWSQWRRCRRPSWCRRPPVSAAATSPGPMGAGTGQGYCGAGVCVRHRCSASCRFARRR